MKNKKDKMYILLLVIAIIVPLVLSVSYAYFQAKITGTDTNVTGKSTNTFDINLITESDGYINAANMLLVKPEEVAEKSSKGIFKVVTGANKHNISYVLSLTDLAISPNLQVADFKWALINTGTGGTVASGTFAGVNTSSYTLKSGIQIAPKTTHNYELRIWIEETTSNQISLAQGTFKGKVSMTADMTYDPVTTPPTASETIIALASDSVTTGVYNEPATDYRYEGLNPNNYVTFNNELWRIIGVFSDNTHGKTGESLIKIIRNDSIGNMEWDEGNINNWEASTLKTYLNGTYINGIESTSKELIENVTWKLGGIAAMTNPGDTYTAERGTTVYSGRPTSGTGHIGLMYPSDYGYSVLASSCVRTTSLYAYNTALCGHQAWLFKSGEFQWTLMPLSSDAIGVWSVDAAGDVTSINSAYIDLAVRPVLYLKSDTEFLSGDGSLGNPYTLRG